MIRITHPFATGVRASISLSGSMKWLYWVLDFMPLLCRPQARIFDHFHGVALVSSAALACTPRFM